MRIAVHGRAAHSSTPWLGDNAVLKAVDVFRTIETLPFSREFSDMFDRPSINLSRIEGGDAMNKVPDLATIAVDVRYLPGQDPGDILAQVRAIPGIDVTARSSTRRSACRATTPTSARCATRRGARSGGEVTSVGRDGASDAASFIEAGIPAVEFGPTGGGHHGPDEWVSLRSMGEYRRALVEFMRTLPAALAGEEGELRAIDGGLREHGCGHSSVERSTREVPRPQEPGGARRAGVLRGGAGDRLLRRRGCHRRAAAGSSRSSPTSPSSGLDREDQAVTLPKPGRPQTLLVIGSDHRATRRRSRMRTPTRCCSCGSTRPPRRSTCMSIPRDLQVTVPGYGTEKINAAYSQGGYGLLIRTIKQNVFPQLQVNHIIDTNFDGFSHIVNAIGCVWTDVDHRYYNRSQPFPSPDNYSSINIQPGYQRLCGSSQVTGALAFVRFRHTDSDLVREARQQDFLRWAKQNFTLSKLYAEKDKLLRIFARETTLDQTLKTLNGIIELFDLVLNANGASLKQIPFPASLGAGSATSPAYVYKKSDRAVAAAWANFMHPTPKGSASSSHHSSSSSSHGSSGGGSHGGSGSSHGAKARHHPGPAIDTAGLTADPADGIAQAKLLSPNMPVYYPRYILSGSRYCTDTGYECLNGDEPASAYGHSYPRQYRVTTTTGKRVRAYFMTIAVNPLLGQYYGVQGVHWTDPPILNNPAGTKVFHGRRFEIYQDDHGRTTDVAWRVDGNSYWISNTLTSTISTKQMVAIAESTVPYGG